MRSRSLGPNVPSLRAKWEGERDVLKKIQENKDRIEHLKIEAQQAERQGDYGRVAEIRYGKIQEAEKQIAALQDEFRAASASGAMIKEEVDAEDVAEVVSRWTGIPVSRMLASEREKPAPHGGGVASPRSRSGFGHCRRVGCRAPFAGRTERSPQADRLVHLPGYDGCR